MPQSLIAKITTYIIWVGEVGGADTALKLVAWGLLVAIVLQVIFYFVFQAVGYDAFSLSVFLIVSIVVLLVVMVVSREIMQKIKRSL